MRTISTHSGIKAALPVRTAFMLVSGIALLSALTLFVATAVGDMLVGLMAALIAFAASAPVLGPVLGADSRSARS